MRLRGERGAALAIAIMVALVTAIAIYAILIMSASQGKQAAVTVKREQARYIAEAALVQAQQKLMLPIPPSSYTGPPCGETLSIGGMTATVTVDGGGSACSGPAPHQIQVNVSY